MEYIFFTFYHKREIEIRYSVALTCRFVLLFQYQTYVQGSNQLVILLFLNSLYSIIPPMTEIDMAVIVNIVPVGSKVNMYENLFAQNVKAGENKYIGNVCVPIYKETFRIFVGK